MFDKKKIILNHIRASKRLNKKANNFLLSLSHILIERANLNIKNNYKILEVGARTSCILDQLKKQKINSTLYQSVLSKNVLIYNKNNIVSEIESSIFKENIFDICFCILSLNSSNSLPLAFKNIFNTLKKNGKFLAVFPAEECLKEFREYFLEYFKKKPNKSFMPYLEIQTLGNLGMQSGFKNIIVDKETFNLKVFLPSDIWNFIRGIGESNYLLGREKRINKHLFLDFCKDYATAIKSGTLKNNTFALNFFIGSK
jgi:hypothetical protein